MKPSLPVPALALSVLPLPALAHPGDHGATGLWHMLTQPDHLALLAVVVVLIGLAVVMLRARR